MGCGAAQPVRADVTTGPTKDDLIAVVVYGARGLRNADSGSKNDAYCIARVGPKGSAWDAKLRGTGRRSLAVPNSSNPQWDMGFAVDVGAMKDPEIQIRIYDKDLFTDDDFLGEAVVLVSQTEPMGISQALWVTVQGESQRYGQPAGSPGTPGDADPQCHIAVGPLSMLEEKGVKPSAFFEKMGPPGAAKVVDVKEVTGEGPLRVGTGPGLPAQMQGIFWLTDQENGSALASFAGPTGDGAGCSTGQMTSNRYKVRVSGDRVWAFANTGSIGFKAVEALDLVYHFVFNDRVNPTRCQIYPEARNIGLTLTAEWLLDFEMVLLSEGHADYPGSVVWRRDSALLGQSGHEYALVQVLDGNGQHIEPAWGKFVAYQNSEAAGSDPGKIVYHDAAK